MYKTYKFFLQILKNPKWVNTDVAELNQYVVLACWVTVEQTVCEKLCFNNSQQFNLLGCRYANADKLNTYLYFFIKMREYSVACRTCLPLIWTKCSLTTDSALSSDSNVKKPKPRTCRAATHHRQSTLHQRLMLTLTNSRVLSLIQYISILTLIYNLVYTYIQHYLA